MAIRNVVYKGKALQTKFEATLIGGPELARQLRRLDDAVRVQASKDVLLAAGEPIDQAASQKAPLGPPPYHLRDAIAVRAAKTKHGASGSVAVRKVRGALDNDEQPTAYAPVIEFGNRDNPAQPFMRPAFDQQKAAAVDAAERVLRDAVSKVAR